MEGAGRLPPLPSAKAAGRLVSPATQGSGQGMDAGLGGPQGAWLGLQCQKNIPAQVGGVQRTLLDQAEAAHLRTLVQDDRAHIHILVHAGGVHMNILVQVGGLNINSLRQNGLLDRLGLLQQVQFLHHDFGFAAPRLAKIPKL